MAVQTLDFEDKTLLVCRELSDSLYDILFVTTEGEHIVQYHSQDCCEQVILEEVIGDLEDLIGTPLLQAEERSQAVEEGSSLEWTFYEFRTVKGSVTLRWCAETDSYYSVDISYKTLSAAEVENFRKYAPQDDTWTIADDLCQARGVTGLVAQYQAYAVLLGLAPPKTIQGNLRHDVVQYLKTRV